MSFARRHPLAANGGLGRRSTLRTDAALFVGAIISATVLACTGTADRGQLAAQTQSLYGGRAIQQCRWSNVVALDRACTGVLLGPTLVAYAAHCGDSFETVYAAEGEAGVGECLTYPDASIIDGTDIGFCHLRDALESSLVVPPAVGCERRRLSVGTPVQVVALGRDAANPAFGMKRFYEAVIVRADYELEIAAAGTGTCDGDSGGPALIRTPQRSGGSVWRVAGIHSSGSTTGAESCGEGRSYFVDLAEYVPWIEQESGVDVTPCFDASGSWAPTADCGSRFTVSESEEECDHDIEFGFDATCGDPFDEGIRPSGGCTLSVGRPPRSPCWLRVLVLLALYRKRTGNRRRNRHARVVEDRLANSSPTPQGSITHSPCRPT